MEYYINIGVFCKFTVRILVCAHSTVTICLDDGSQIILPALQFNNNKIMLKQLSLQCVPIDLFKKSTLGQRQK